MTAAAASPKGLESRAWGLPAASNQTVNIREPAATSGRVLTASCSARIAAVALGTALVSAISLLKRRRREASATVKRGRAPTGRRPQRTAIAEYSRARTCRSGSRPSRHSGSLARARARPSASKTAPAASAAAVGSWRRSARSARSVPVPVISRFSPQGYGAVRAELQGAVRPEPPAASGLLADGPARRLLDLPVHLGDAH